MTSDQVMSELAAHGTAQNRKVYARHGYPENTFGVSFNVLRNLSKQSGIDHELARALWATGNGDARILATMVADAAAMSASELDAWVGDITWYVLADAFATLAARSPLRRQKCDQWRVSEKDLVGQIGWNLVGSEASDPDADHGWLAARIAEIEAGIHHAGNRTKHAMNMALCAIGGHQSGLTRPAILAARRIGKVVVDHGETGCRTPQAEPYIERMVAHRASKLAAHGRKPAVPAVPSRRVGGKKSLALQRREPLGRG